MFQLQHSMKMKNQEKLHTRFLKLDDIPKDLHHDNPYTDKREKNANLKLRLARDERGLALYGVWILFGDGI